MIIGQMHYAQLFFFVISLVIPFGAFEQDGASVDEIKLQLSQSCVDEASVSFQTEASEPELISPALLVVELPAQLDCNPVMFRSTVFETASLDCLGCRPPPVAWMV